MQEIKELLSNENAGTVRETLDFMLYECSLDEAPGEAEVREWQEILKTRGSKFAACAELCRKWLEEEHHAAQ